MKLTDEINNLIVTLACDLFETNEEVFRSKYRGREVSDARKAYCLIGHRNFKGNKQIFIKTIARDRTTYFHLLQKAKELIEVDKKFKINIAIIEIKIGLNIHRCEACGSIITK